MKSILYTLSVALLTLAVTARAAEPGPRVIASIKPVQYLVAAVMQGVGAPDLLLKSTASPHSYTLRPSDVRAIQEAQLVFWIGEPMEFFLGKLLASTGTPQIALIETPGLALLSLRRPGLWHGSEVEEHHDEHQHGSVDPHIWLDPDNALLMVRRISMVLSEIDPGNAAHYQANAAHFSEQLRIMDNTFKIQLEPVRNTPYIVFHDAYHYFEQHYGLHVAGSIIVSPEQPPGARRIQQIRDYIRAERAQCVFSEPQFEPRLVHLLVEDSAIRTAVLDPLGVTLGTGPDSYFELLAQLVESLSRCLQVPALQ